MITATTALDTVMPQIMTLLKELGISGRLILHLRRARDSKNFGFDFITPVDSVVIHTLNSSSYINEDKRSMYLLNHNLKQAQLDSAVDTVQKILQSADMKSQYTYISRWYCNIDLNNNKFESKANFRQLKEDFEVFLHA